MALLILSPHPVPPTPSLESFLPRICRFATSLLDHIPGPRSHDIFDALLLTDQHGKLLRTRFSREEPPRVWVQALVYHSLLVSGLFNLPHQGFGIVGVRTRCDYSAVVQNLGSRMPRREQGLVFEVLAGLGVYLSREGLGGPLRSRRWVESSSRGCYESIEVLGYRVVDAGA